MGSNALHAIVKKQKKKTPLNRGTAATTLSQKIMCPTHREMFVHFVAQWEKLYAGDEKSMCQDQKSMCQAQKSVCGHQKSVCWDQKSMCLHGKAFTVYPILSGGLFCSSCFARTLDARAAPHAHNPQKTPRTGSLGGVKKKSPSWECTCEACETHTCSQPHTQTLAYTSTQNMLISIYIHTHMP